VRGPAGEIPVGFLGVVPRGFPRWVLRGLQPGGTRVGVPRGFPCGGTRGGPWVGPPDVPLWGHVWILRCSPEPVPWGGSQCLGYPGGLPNVNPVGSHGGSLGASPGTFSRWCPAGGFTAVSPGVGPPFGVLRGASVGFLLRVQREWCTVRAAGWGSHGWGPGWTREIWEPLGRFPWGFPWVFPHGAPQVGSPVGAPGASAGGVPRGVPPCGFPFGESPTWGPRGVIRVGSLG
jgi:hypothetical protein